MSLEGLIEKFRAVALDRVEKMDVLLVDAEREATDPVVDELQREIHTLKGEAKMMGFADVNLVAHLTEHLILLASEQRFSVGPEFIETTFEGLDVLRALLTKTPGAASAPIDLAGFVDRVTELRRPGAGETEAGDAFERPTTAQRKRIGDSSLLRINASGSTRVDLGKLERLGEITGEILLASRRQGFQIGELDLLRSRYTRMTERLASVLPKSLLQDAQGFGHELDVAVSDLRTNVGQVSQWGTLLDAQTRELRHLPLDQALQHYPRAVRDLAAARDKRVRFTQDVTGVEVDRLVLTGLSDPLLHLIRNAVDHGIESPAERRAAGKPEEGHVALSAEMAGDSIRVILTDDGAGIDPELIARKAVERGLVTGPDARTMSEDELLALIFEQGFSTRDQVTDVSGRGIGMDIVRRQVGAIGGSVELESTPGEGTTFILVLPISSSVGAILAFLIGERVFAIPAKDIERVEFIDHSELRGGSLVPVSVDDETDDYALTPLLDWRKLLGPQAQATPRGRLTLLHVRRGGRSVAMWVDDILGEREAMTRPLGQFLAGVRICRGVAITNAGEVIPLLSVNELLSAENFVSSDARRSVRATLELPKIVAPKRILVVEDSEITRALVSGILRDLGLNVTEAEDGWRGWELVQSEKFDLVMTDVQMPRMSGLELLQSIRSDRRLGDLPVVVLSTLGEKADMERALKLGANAYLVKLDFQEKDLIRTVRRFLD